MTQPSGFKKSNIFLFLAVSVLIRMTSSVGRKQSQILTTKVYFLLSHLSVDFWLELWSSTHLKYCRSLSWGQRSQEDLSSLLTVLAFTWSELDTHFLDKKKQDNSNKKPTPTKWKSLNCVWLFVTPSCSSVHGILQARILEWVAISFSREYSQPREQTQIFYVAGSLLTVLATREVQEYWNGKPFPSAGYLPDPGI